MIRYHTIDPELPRKPLSSAIDCCYQGCTCLPIYIRMSETGLFKPCCKQASTLKLHHH
jgi:hypothetical protein